MFVLGFPVVSMVLDAGALVQALVGGLPGVVVVLPVVVVVVVVVLPKVVDCYLVWEVGFGR